MKYKCIVVQIMCCISATLLYSLWNLKFEIYIYLLFWSQSSFHHRRSHSLLMMSMFCYLSSVEDVQEVQTESHPEKYRRVWSQSHTTQLSLTTLEDVDLLLSGFPLFEKEDLLELVERILLACKKKWIKEKALKKLNIPSFSNFVVWFHGYYGNW